MDIPVLIVYGDDDPITSPETTDRLQSSGGSMTVTRIEGGRHGFPDPFNHRQSEASVLRFVKQVLTGPGHSPL